MLLDRTNKIINISVPKTGSTSVYYALRACTGNSFEFDNQQPALYHMYASDVMKLVGEEVWGNYYSFGIVRNPYDRIVSLFCDFKYQRRSIRYPTFSSFLRFGLKKRLGDVHFHPQVNFLKDKDRLIVTDFFKFEDGLQAAVDAVSLSAGIRGIKLGHARKGMKNKVWLDYFKYDRDVDMVNEIYAKDFEAFGYIKIGSVSELKFLK